MNKTPKDPAVIEMLAKLHREWAEYCIKKAEELEAML